MENIIASADSSKLNVTVGSNSNVGENRMAVKQGLTAAAIRVVNSLGSGPTSLKSTCEIRSARPGSQACMCCSPWSMNVMHLVVIF